MLVRGVIDDQVEQDLDAPVAGPVQQFGEVAQGTDPGVDPVEVGDVVAVVPPGGRVHRAQPETGHAQPGQVVQPTDETAQVADAVGV